MNELDGEFYSSDQSPTTPAVAPAKDSSVRPHGDMLKMMNPTPNGYSSVPNHKPKSEGQEIKKHHEGKNSIDHKHSSDHVKKKDDDSSKHNSSHSKSKESSKEGKGESQSGHSDKEKKLSSHKDSSKTKDSSNKHSDHSKHSSSSKKDDKHKSDSSKKEHHSSDGKPKTDNFKENEKIKDSSLKEGKSKEHKEKHKDKHKDKEHKEKHKDKSSSDKTKEKSEKPKEKSDKPKGEGQEKHKEKHKEHKDKQGEKHKDKEHGEKHKDKERSEKHKDKERSEKHKDKERSEKHKDKVHSEKHKDKEHSEKHKDKEHSEKHKDKEHSEKHKEKHKDKHDEKHKEKVKVKEEKIKEVKIKQEPVSPVKDSSPGRLIIKEEFEIVKEEPMSDEDIPLAERHASILANESIKREIDSDDEPLSSRIEKKIKTEKKKKKPTSDDEDYEMEVKPKKRKKAASDDDEEYEAKKPSKKVKKEKVAAKIKKEIKIKQEPETTASPKKRGKKEEDEQEVWKWWEEEKLEDGLKWKTLEHSGPVFAPPYERVPKNVKFYYDGKHMELSELTEEVAGFYGKMLDHEYTSKDVFNTNFFKDWKKVMTAQEKETIKDLKKCNFNDFNVYYKMKSEERKNMTKEEKLAIRKENEELTKKYGFCIIDGHKQKIGNFKIEPPGLFRGRGEHPKMGMLKRRVEAEDILINVGRESKVPPPPQGHKWKEVRHDNTVSWLASWSENILGSTKYIMLNPSSKLKGEKDWQKYETARKLKAHADRIREEYTRDFKSKEMKVRQRAVALYFIDKLALRAGNEKDEDTADTVGCCSLRVEHITLDDEKDGQEYVVSFDFLGKDSIRYFNSVPVEKRAYKNLKLFMENKQPGDDLFDRLNTAILNKYLNDLMEGLTAKVFRTYNASKTLQEQLDLLTKEEMSIPEKILAYNRANRAVAILCNHQRAVPKGFSKSMENLKTKMDEKENQIKEFKKELKSAKQAAKEGGSKDKMLFDKKKKRLAQLEEQLKKLEVQATDKEENKQIALGTSKLNYLDPRISVAWCKKWGVPIEKIYNRTQRDKFRWAIEMAGPDYKF